MRIGLGIHVSDPPRSGFTPYVYAPNVKLWLPPDTTDDVTLSSASVADGSAFGTGSWARTNIPTVNSNTITDPDGGSAADGLVESVDGANAEHYIGQTPTNIAARTATFAVSLKVGARQWVLVAANNGTAGVWFDLTNGVKGTEASATGTIASQGNGWYRCTITYTHSANSVRLYAATSNGTAVYTGNGSVAFYAYNAVVTQARVASEYDLAGQGSSAASQGTIGNQPLWVPSWFNGLGAALYDNADDVLAGTIAGVNANSDLTVLAVSQMSANDDQCLLELSGDTSPNNGFSVFSFGGQRIFRASSGGATSDVGYAFSALTPTITSALHTGASRRIFENGTLKATTTAARTTPALANYRVGLFFGGTVPMGGHIAPVLVINRLLTDDEHLQLVRYVGQRYGIATA